MSEIAGTLPRNFVKVLHLGKESSSVGAVDEKMQTSEIQRETGAFAKVPFAALIDFDPEVPLRNKHCFNFMLCKQIRNMASWGVSELGGILNKAIILELTKDTAINILP